MAQRIQLKRGNKVNLPTLDSGEIAYSIDTNELYVGDGIKNYNCSTSNSNLVLNSNFVLPITNDNEKETIAANSKKYFMGNYYITNVNQATILKTYDGFIGIQTTGTFTLEYKERTSVKGSTPFNGLPINISFDIVNNKTTPITFYTGFNNELKSTTMSGGAFRASVNIEMKYLQNKSYSLVIFSSVSQVIDIRIGNIKIEQSKEETKDGSNHPYLTSSCLEMNYKMINGIYRATKITTNTIEFIIPIYICQYFSEKVTPTYNLQSVQLYDKSGTSLTGFTKTVSLNNEFNLSFCIICTKANHGVTDGCIDVKLEYSIL